MVRLSVAEARQVIAPDGRRFAILVNPCETSSSTLALLAAP
jgi:hypothetical protein